MVDIEVVDTVPVITEPEEISMETEATAPAAAPEPSTSMAATPMHMTTTSEPQPSKAILDPSTSSSLIPTGLEQTLQLSYPSEPTQNPTEIELDLRKSLPDQLVKKVKSLTELFQKVDLQLIPSEVNTSWTLFHLFWR